MNRGISEQVNGSDLLTENKMKPWWETFHGYLLATSITASGLIVYFTASGQQVDCLPVSENASALSDSQVNLINGYCTGQIPWYVIYSGILTFVIATVILVASNMWLSHPDVIDAVRTFMKAATIIYGLPSRSMKLKQMAMTPVFTEQGEAFELRKACLLLWTNRNKIRWQYAFRNYLVVSMTVVAFIGTLTMSILMTDLVVDPHFNCSVSARVKNNLHMPLQSQYLYFCSYNYAQVIFPFILLSAIAFLAQISILATASFKLRPIRMSDYELNVFSDEFLQARAYCRFMTIFWRNASPVDSRRFLSLLNYIFSSEAVTAMVRYIPKAISNADTENNGISFHPSRNDTEYRYNSLPNPDLTYVELYTRMHRSGGNNALSKLYKLFEGRNFGKDYHDIEVALKRVEFTEWSVAAQNFVKAASERKYWDLLITILSSFNESKVTAVIYQRKLNDNVYDLKLEDLEIMDEKGNNIIYYALCKDERDSDFNTTAFKHILACIRPKGKLKLTVYNQSQKMSAEEFVVSQYERDPTITEELKFELVAMIKDAGGR